MSPETGPTGQVEDPLPPEAFVSRILVTAHIAVTDIVDFRTAAGRAQAGLVLKDLQSATTDKDAYRRCQLVAQLAHQLGRRGIVAPAATGLGETLVLFTDLLPADQAPVRARDDRLWRTLPPDPRQPRRLRAVDPL